MMWSSMKIPLLHTFNPLFRVSLLTALRIWVSLPDEPTGTILQPQSSRPPAPRASNSQVSSEATCNLYCNCSLERISSGRVMQVYHHQQENVSSFQVFWSNRISRLMKISSGSKKETKGSHGPP